MNGKKARELRRIVYGEETYRQRDYKFSRNSGRRRSSGTLSAGAKRTVYRTLKRMHREPTAKVMEVLRRRHRLAIKIGEA